MSSSCLLERCEAIAEIEPALALKRCRGQKEVRPLFILSDDKASNAFGSKFLGTQDK